VDPAKVVTLFEEIKKIIEEREANAKVQDEKMDMEVDLALCTQLVTAGWSWCDQTSVECAEKRVRVSARPGGVHISVQRDCQEGLASLPGYCGIAAIRRGLQGNPSGKDPREGVSTAKAFQQAVKLAYQDPRVAMLPPALMDRWKVMMGEMMLEQKPLSLDMMTEDGLLDAQRLTEFLDTQFLVVTEEQDSGWASLFSFERQTMTVRELVENSPSRGKKDQLICVEDGHCKVYDWRPYAELLKDIFPEEVMDSTIVLSDANPYQWKALKSPLRGVPLSSSPSVTDSMSRADLATRRLDGQRDPDQGCLLASSLQQTRRGDFHAKLSAASRRSLPTPWECIGRGDSC
jgi:hypothetical protein